MPHLYKSKPFSYKSEPSEVHICYRFVLTIITTKPRMNTKQLIVLAIANKSSISKSIHHRSSTRTNHQFLIPLLTKSGYEVTFLERFWSVLKRILIFNNA